MSLSSLINNTRHGKVYDGVGQGLRSHVHDAITRMDRILNAASEEIIVDFF